MTFAIFMEEALYGEGGYYRRDQVPIGRGGDFITGSAHSSLFGRTTAELLNRMDRMLGKSSDFLEVGCGNGTHLRAVMEALNGKLDERRWLAADRITRRVPSGATFHISLEGIPVHSVSGLIFSYELFDALPVHRLTKTERGLEEQVVGLDSNDRFCWQESALSSPQLATLVPKSLELGQIADVADWGGLYRTLARRLSRGVIVSCDYGFERAKLFDARIRQRGTLAAYRRHRVHRDPFTNVGEQDLTAHVDFSALIEAGNSEGLETLVLTRQAAWLAALGIFDGLGDRSPRERLEAMDLLNLDGMGEEIRVLVQTKGLGAADFLDPAILTPA